MEFVYNDGGRMLAGFKGTTGDCVVRAVAIASGLPYKEVYDFVQTQAKTERPNKRGRNSSARGGVFVGRKWFKDYMRSLGFVWVPCMGLGTGCQVHLKSEELPLGRIIVSLSRHWAAVIDGVLHDTYQDDREGTRCVYGYWKLEG